MKNFAIKSIAFALGLATAFAVGSYVTPEPASETVAAMWAHHFKTPTGLVAGADLVVIAEHVAAQPGRVVGSTPYTDNGFLVHQVLKGRFQGRELVVEQTGGLRDDGSVLLINDGGAYVRGQRYLLFLKDQGNGVHYLINAQGRYEIGDNGRLTGLEPDDAVVAAYHGQPVHRAMLDVTKRAEMVK